MLLAPFSKTKIVCTIGPAVNTRDRLIQLLHAGMNVARVNFSHGQVSQHLKTLELLKAVREELKVPLAIMLDTKGPETRVGKMPKEGLELYLKQRILLVKEDVEGSSEAISLVPGDVLGDIQEGMQVLFDDGYISSKVISVSEKGVLLEVEQAGILKSSKGVNIPGAKLSLPAITEKDREDIEFGCKQGIDIIAASFIRSAEHVQEIRRLLESLGSSKVRLIAKIENRQGIENFDSIIQVSDGIMIARGDLGVEVALSKVPGFQKMMIRTACMHGKPTTTATQMLESMIYHPCPTRAEVSDVANAIYDSTSSVMLSGETAMGKYPEKTVKVMKDIILETEKDFDYRGFFKRYSDRIFQDVPAAISLAAVKTAYSTHATAIFCMTSSGFTARCISRVRPKIPIITLTFDKQVYHQLASNWGVVPLYAEKISSIEEAYAYISSFALEGGFVSHGDLVIIVAGSPFGVPGTANMMLVERVGKVLIRGRKGVGKLTQGYFLVVEDLSTLKVQDVKKKILFLRACKEKDQDLLKHAKGVVLAEKEGDSVSKACVESLSIPHITGVSSDYILNIPSGNWVTMDPEKTIVFENFFEEGRDSRLSHPLT